LQSNGTERTSRRAGGRRQSLQPGREAGLERGDIILEINGKPVSDSRELRMNISMMKPDADVKLKILRDGNKAT